ncbi:integrase catalytic domain-containing protein [Trichonephila clavipes]|nr:integrase catalytic domain-containing protein [Trichonephila clavipes]
MDILKLNKAKTSLKGSITRIATFMDNVSEHVDITELEVKLKKIDQLQRKIEELKELLFGLETANPTEEAEFEEDLYKCETRLDDLEMFFNFRLNRVAISSDIRQAFLQICLADKHKDFVRFLWTDSNPRIGGKLTLQVYRFNRVIFGVNSSPFLLAATIKYHIEKYNEIHPITVQHLDSFMYVDDWITGQDTREEALFMSRHAKNIMKEAGMEMRKWISNDTVLMAQWAAEGFDTHPMDASIRLGTNKTKVLGMAWQTLDDCLTLDTKDNLRIPRLVLDSTNDEVSDLIEIHIFCDASKLAYGAAAYVKSAGDLELTDPDSWFHCSGQDNPSDFLSRGLSVDTLISNNKWWTGPAFLRTDELPKTVSECPELNEVDYLPELKSKDSKEHTVLTLNFNQTFLIIYFLVV